MSLDRSDKAVSKDERQEHQGGLDRRDKVPPKPGGEGGGGAQTAGLSSGGRHTRSTAPDFPVPDLRSSPPHEGRSRIARCPGLEAGGPNPPPSPNKFRVLFKTDHV